MGRAVAAGYRRLLPAAAVVVAVAAVAETVRTVALGATRRAAMPVADVVVVTVCSSRMAGLNRT